MSVTTSVALVAALDALVLAVLAAACAIAFRIDRPRPPAPTRMPTFDPVLEPDLADRRRAA